ncbi:hypothetical protein MTX78_19120 [Hymenobacter tibetensis]|uniref:Anti-sigma factor n=1 Tax=Hymenobacter tibetensis TaxID=497967 RepID=A0ABY4CVT7_9BACT|nr:hypothetical protein [Hymenobacter tibetensis]UOG74221.1 hypothetical protein MTX78_19120 [Hymenobacter tibetensis]
MNDKETGLENFIERHRAEFDVFEPRPDLWDDIEQELAAPTAGPVEQDADETIVPKPLRIVKLYPEAPAATLAASSEPLRTTNSNTWLPRPGIAAAVALLVLAGVGAVWNNEQHTTGWTNTGTAPLVLAAPSPAPTDANTGLYFGASPVTNSQEAPAQQLTKTVQRMETYFASQIRERQQELQQLEAETPVASAPAADWQRELASLDSTYRQLKVELYRNPEPDVVLEAMNRNLQIRLDILNQQTRFREQAQEYTAQPLMIADNHPMP